MASNLPAPVPGPAASGQLRIYLGYAPGAGTTSALLREGHRRAERGADVVVAIAQTHGRPHTQALLAGLEIIPSARVLHRGAVVEEMDLGAVLARRPEVALVDELARGNAPDSRHGTRWQEIEDLLAAGIDVISTVSVAHLDSLTDVVGKIAGVSPLKTVPDQVVRAAREVEMVDIAPELLRDRMARGQIYPPNEAQAALASWFRIGNLSALRELALVWLAATLASNPHRYRPGGPGPDSGHARERVVVALGGGPEDETLIRRAARIAARSRADLLAVHAARPGGPADPGRAALAGQRRLIESLGGAYHQVADEDIPAALLAFAHAGNATQLVLGATRCTWLALLRPRTGIKSQVIRRGGGIGVHIVTCTPTANSVPPGAGDPNQKGRTVIEQDISRSGSVRPSATWGRRRAAPSERTHRRRRRWLASAAVAATALILAACGGSLPGYGGVPSTPPAGAPSTPPAGAASAAASGGTVKTTTIHGVTVLTSAQGFTFYSFAPDTMTASKCNSSCAHIWPPATGPVTRGPGVTGTVGTITRANGATQATYNGHPLYTYTADTAPGQASGNGINAFGGIWHEVTPTGEAAPAHSSGAGGSGY